MTFDARAAKLLQAGEHLILPEHPGLRLVASESRHTWQYRYKSRVDGGMKKFKLGEWPAMSYQAAVAAWEKKKAERDSGVDPALQKRSARRQEREAAAAEKVGPYTVERLVDDYLSGHIDVRRKPKGRAEIRRLLTAHTKPIATRPADQLLRSEAYELLQGLSDRPVLMGQVRREMGAAYEHALDAGRLPAGTPNWWRQVFRGKLPRSRGKTIQGVHVGATKRVLSEQELGILINWLPNFTKMVADALTLYLWTGCRGAEITQMLASEIAEEQTGWWWTIPKHKTKNMHRENASDLRVPLIGRAKALVLRRLDLARRSMQETGEADAFLFPSTGKLGYVEQKTIQSTVYAFQPYSRSNPDSARPRLPVTRWSPHDLRRSVRTLLASMGCPGEVAESVLGHILPGVVGVYNRHAYDAERVEWLTRLDAKLEQLALEHAAS